MYERQRDFHRRERFLYYPPTAPRKSNKIESLIIAALAFLLVMAALFYFLAVEPALEDLQIDKAGFRGVISNNTERR